LTFNANSSQQASGEVIEILGKPALRPNQEKVRSTTQQRGSTTKPFASSLPLAISVRSNGTFATAASTCHALSPPFGPDQLKPWETMENLVEHQPAPARS
jgi:hypothetical protein